MVYKKHIDFKILLKKGDKDPTYLQMKVKACSEEELHKFIAKEYSNYKIEWMKYEWNIELLEENTENT